MRHNYLLNTVTGPAVEPISLQAAKDYLRVDYNQEDEIISTLISAARQQVEALTQRALISTTFDWLLGEQGYGLGGGACGWNGWYGGYYGYGLGNPSVLFVHPVNLVLPRNPVQSITSVTYLNANGITETLDPSKYLLRQSSEGVSRLVSAVNQSFPVGAVTVRFVAGWTDPDSVPAAIRSAMLLLISHLFNHREAASDIKLDEVPLGVQSLLSVWSLRGYQ